MSLQPPAARGPLRRLVLVGALATASALAALPVHAAPRLIVGEALAVHDGDSFELREAGGTRIGVRIAGIDAPEKGQPWSDVSRRHLAGLLRARTLAVLALKTDRYGRTVGDVSVDGVDVGLEQLRQGLAWHFTRFAASQPPAQREAYARAEAQARERRIGLWVDPAPTPPWIHRDARRAKDASAGLQPRIAGSNSPALP